MSLEEQSRHYESIQKSLEYLDKNFYEQPNLDVLATHVGMSKYHFSRVFKAYAGVTPMQFLQATTLAHAKTLLTQSRSNLDASLELGLSNPSRLHELFVNFIGITPKEYKTLGENLHITYGFGFSPFGKAMLAYTNKGICALEFYENSPAEVLTRLQQTWQNAHFTQNNTLAQERLDAIFIQKQATTLFVKGTNFQINVWRALLNIAPAKVSTYTDIAQALGKPKAVRAVASAIGANHIGVLIPCHRVIAKTAAMSGYRWGVTRKKIILACETQL